MSNRKNPDTSLEAHTSLEPAKLRQTYKDILFALSQLKEATSEEIAHSLNVKPDKIWRRLGEMGKLGLIHRPGTRRPLKSGSMGYTWAKTNEGISPEIITERFPTGVSAHQHAANIIQQTKLF